jgi:hypothetical protein
MAEALDPRRSDAARRRAILHREEHGGNGKAEPAAKQRNLSWRTRPIGDLAQQHRGVARDRGAIIEHRGACLEPRLIRRVGHRKEKVL